MQIPEKFRDAFAPVELRSFGEEGDTALQTIRFFGVRLADGVGTSVYLTSIGQVMVWNDGTASGDDVPTHRVYDTLAALRESEMARDDIDTDAIVGAFESMGEPFYVDVDGGA